VSQNEDVMGVSEHPVQMKQKQTMAKQQNNRLSSLGLFSSFVIVGVEESKESIA